ncbi:phospholipase A-2-activating protein [Diaphorina citri]|uniref:Phospholipase A-2-activating protein n=1 Tax=Diaphorina citri TaxID=121845 RepID=A0A3Q0J9A0_DIACI|nr:phospholipase A-2-activating protein [Diaphorina citri]
MTAKLWCLESQQCKLTIRQHEMAVWGVIQLANGIIVTGCADKTIKLHSEEGEFLKTLTGHTDCVRGLAVLNDTDFVSCSNDASIRVWDSTTGKCVHTMYGHPNFIYSVAAHGDLITSGGEDQCVCVYQNKAQNSFMIPAMSVWAVAILPNSDIVTGSSDGIVRVFSANPDRQAEDAVQAQYAEEVKKLKSANEQEIGGVKVSDLPGKEVLYEPGKADGDVKMVREGSTVVAYSWSEASREWNKLGDVMGSAGGTQESSGKVLYQGKEYDFVFSVDIEEGKPPLKLPYNVSEDPWHAAQAFIHTHHLSQMFLEQVANFIMTNSKSKQGPTVTQTPPSGEYCDPFTGGARYVPGSGTPVPVAPVTNAGDPFTGANRYKPSGSTPDVASPAVTFFPLNDYVRFDQANLKAILDKLKQFTETLREKTDVSPSIVIPSEAQLDSLGTLGEPSPKAAEDVLNLLKQLLEWPPEFVFPILDLTRLGVRNVQINEALCGGRTGRQMISLLRSFLNADSSVNNQMLTLRILTNMFSHQPGEELVLSHKEYIFSILDELSHTKLIKSMQIALVSLLLNCIIAYRKRKDDASLTHSLEILTKMLPNLIETEALLRALIALGTLICDSPSLRKSVHNGVKDLILKLSESNPGSETDSRVNQCALKLVDVILS